MGEVLENSSNKIPNRETFRNKLKKQFNTMVSDSPGIVSNSSIPVDHSVVMKFNLAVYKMMESNEFKHHDQIEKERDRKK